MKNFYFALAFLILTFKFEAQISVTNKTFPVIGDTLKYATSINLPIGFSIGTSNGPKEYDFSALKSGSRYSEVYLSPQKGVDVASFPDANLLVINSGQEQYLKSSTTKIEGLGFGGSNGFIPVPLVVKYNKKPVLKSAPLEFISTSASNGEFRIDISTNILPDTLLAGLPIKPDSIRIQFNSSFKGLIDGYGTLMMQNKSFEVLREKAESVTETTLSVKVFGLWLDPSALLGGTIPGGFGAFLGKDTTVTYNFYAETMKEVLVSAEYNSTNELQSVTFADLGGITSATDEITQLKFNLYPNPTSDVLKISLSDWKEGNYFLTITDMSGKLVHFEATKIDPIGTKDINTSALTEGMYIFNIRDQFNRYNSSLKFIKQ